MSYIKNEWKTGDIVTAAKLNNMENGITNADTINGMLYIVPGDYSDGDELSVEEYSRLWQVCDNGGVSMISATNHPVFIGNLFGFWNCFGEKLEIDSATHFITIIPAGNGGIQ